MDTTIIVGRERSFVRDIASCLKENISDELDFLLIPLFHPRYRRDNNGISLCRESPATRSDRELECGDWNNRIIGKISDWLDLDNLESTIQSSSFTALRQEMMWASHLCLQAVVLPTPSLLSLNYARSIMQLCGLNNYQQLWVRIPLTNVGFTHHNAKDIDTSHSANITEGIDGWKVWDNFRHHCGHTHRLCVALELNSTIDELHGADCVDLLLRRWAAEPVKALFVDISLFITNKAGFPVLSKQRQRLLEFFFDFRVKLILTGVPSHSCVGGSTNSAAAGSKSTDTGPGGSYMPYVQYLRYLKSRFASQASKVGDARANMAYRDTLQSPLQPLMDNLESQTYETFERDPVKYQCYEAAMAQAMADKLADSITHGSPLPELVVTVVGAGRGPLVAAALSAACLAGVSVRVFAVEKNPNAVVTLRNRVRTERWTNVTVVEKDMRAWNPPELCDLMVSELLGSFGDNELSPECLDGAQKCLKSDGISIPGNYTSFVAPISAAMLWKGVTEMLDGKGVDTPFVVKLHSFFQSVPAQPLFRFDHPSPPPPHIIDNSRFGSVSFVAPVRTTVHGMAGYFESVLYKDITLSILPETHTPGMFSWFPLFIPLSRPVQVEAGDTVTFNMWRCCDSHRVWYEWNLSSPSILPIQNCNGKNYFIGL